MRQVQIFCQIGTPKKDLGRLTSAKETKAGAAVFMLLNMHQHFKGIEKVILHMWRPISTP